jgi:hypothetical protein
MERCRRMSAFALWIVVSSIELPAQSPGSADATWEKAEAAGRSHDYTSEVRLCTELAAQGDVRGQVCLGGIYLAGVPGFPKNDQEALKWEGMAAKQGEASSQFRVGGFNLDGVSGVPPNPAEAARWYRRAADQGYPDAQFSLAILYFNGKGVAQNYVQSYMWVNLAIANPHHHYHQVGTMTTMRNRIAQRMARDQIAEAQRLASDWKPRIDKATCIASSAMCAE